MSVTIRTHERKFHALIDQATAEGLQRAGVFYHNACRHKVNKSNAGVRMKRTRDTKRGKKGSQYTIYPNSSKPGEAPRARTGFGRQNIVYEYNDNPKDPAVRVGVMRNGKYMWYLELGTKRIAARPWLLRTLLENKEQIARLAAIGGKHRLP
jgi:hypothetical protein